MGQLTLLGAAAAALPAGFVYLPELLDPAGAEELLGFVDQLEFHEARMRGQVARRRLAHFGYRYDLASARLSAGPALPAAIVELRERAAAAAGLGPEPFVQALVTRYPPGAGIGWHRDAPGFGPTVLGVSLRTPATMRFRPHGAGGRATLQVTLEPGSLYVIGGEARSRWEHSLSPVKELRYVVTLRTLR